MTMEYRGEDKARKRVTALVETMKYTSILVEVTASDPIRRHPMDYPEFMRTRTEYRLGSAVLAVSTAFPTWLSSLQTTISFHFSILRIKWNNKEGEKERLKIRELKSTLNVK
jgi:hypothetical protein